MDVLFSADQFTAILLVMIVVAMTQWEKQLYGTYMSPIFLMAVPYTILIVIINFIAVYFGYFAVSYKANLWVLLFFLIFFLVGLMINKMFQSKQLVKDIEKKDVGTFFNQFEAFYRIIAIVSIIAGVLQLKHAVGQVGLMGVGTVQFKQAYGGGIFGHIMLFSRPAFFFLFASTMKRWNIINAILLLIIFVLVGVPQVKYQIITLIVAAVIFSVNIGVIKVTIRKIIFAMLAIYFLFNISYVIGFSASGLDYAYSDKIQAFLFNHFFTYLFGGPIGFSEVLEMKQYPYSSIVELLAVPVNIYKAILGDSQYVGIIIQSWFPISTITKYFHGTNTFGLFGMLYAYAGISGAGLFTMFYAILAYSFFQFSILKKENLSFQIAYAYLGAFLVLSFFGLYLNMLPFYEILVYIIFLHSIALILQKLNRLNYSYMKKDD